MSGFGAHHDGADAGASWRALSGDATPPPPAPAAPPVQGGWQQAWQDEFGQWHSPYAELQPPMAPPYAGADQLVHQPQPEPQQYAMPPQPAHAPEPPVQPQQSQPQPQPVFVEPAQLAPVGPPRYLAPTRVARDPRQRTMAAVITFVALLVGLWGILGFLGAMSQTLSSIASGNQKLKLQMTEANKGLVSLDEKTRVLEQMNDDSSKMKTLLSGIDKDMGSMLTGVNGIAEGMSSMSTSLGTLDGELGKVNDINSGMAAQLGTINAGLADQVKSVRTMRRDVEATGRVLGSLPGRLTATNSRLGHVNRVVDVMGCQGITNNLKVTIKAGPIPTGAATVYATVIPAGAWGYKEDGKTPC